MAELDHDRDRDGHLVALDVGLDALVAALVADADALAHALQRLGEVAAQVGDALDLHGRQPGNLLDHLVGDVDAALELGGCGAGGEAGAWAGGTAGRGGTAAGRSARSALPSPRVRMPLITAGRVRLRAGSSIRSLEKSLTAASGTSGPSLPRCQADAGRPPPLP